MPGARTISARQVLHGHRVDFAAPALYARQRCMAIVLTLLRLPLRSVWWESVSLAKIDLQEHNPTNVDYVILVLPVHHIAIT